MKVAKLSALLPAGTPGTYSCQRLSRTEGRIATGRIKSMNTTNGPIGNRTCELPGVAQSLNQLRHWVLPVFELNVYIYIYMCVCVCMYLLLNHFVFLCRKRPVHFAMLASQATRFMMEESRSDPPVSTGCRASCSGILQWVKRTKLVRIWQNYRNTTEIEEGTKLTTDKM
jgi:hypothetical protein